MNKQTINQLNSYYKKCVETDYTNVNFEKLIIATCVLISEARLNCNFPSGIEKTCLLIEQKIEKLMHLKGVKSEHLHLAAKIFSEIAQHKFPAQTTVEHYLIATLDALGLKCKILETDPISRLYPKIVHLETQAVCNAKCSF